MLASILFYDTYRVATKFMGIKSEKTFEEIVERLIAVFRPEGTDADPRAPVPESAQTVALENTFPEPDYQTSGNQTKTSRPGLR